MVMIRFSPDCAVPVGASGAIEAARLFQSQGPRLSHNSGAKYEHVSKKHGDKDKQRLCHVNYLLVCWWCVLLCRPAGVPRRPIGSHLLRSVHGSGILRPGEDRLGLGNPNPNKATDNYACNLGLDATCCELYYQVLFGIPVTVCAHQHTVCRVICFI